MFAFVLAGGQDLDDEDGHLKCKIKINLLPANFGVQENVLGQSNVGIRAPVELIN